MVGHAPVAATRTRYVVGLGLGLPLAVFIYVGADVLLTGHVASDGAATRLVDRAVSRAAPPSGGALLLEHANLAGLLVLTGVTLTLLLAATLRAALFWATAVGAVFLLDPLLKAVFARPGIGVGEYSFPSGSALFSAVAVAAIAYLVPTSRLHVVIAAAGAGVCFAVGAAVVYVDWHYPSDVVAGWAFGLAWTTAVWLAYSRRAHVARRTASARSG